MSQNGPQGYPPPDDGPRPQRGPSYYGPGQPGSGAPGQPGPQPVPHGFPPPGPQGYPPPWSNSSRIPEPDPVRSGESPIRRHKRRSPVRIAAKVFAGLAAVGLLDHVLLNTVSGTEISSGLVDVNVVPVRIPFIGIQVPWLDVAEVTFEVNPGSENVVAKGPRDRQGCFVRMNTRGYGEPFGKQGLLNGHSVATFAEIQQGPWAYAIADGQKAIFTPTFASDQVPLENVAYKGVSGWVVEGIEAVRRAGGASPDEAKAGGLVLALQPQTLTTKPALGRGRANTDASISSICS